MSRAAPRGPPAALNNLVDPFGNCEVRLGHGGDPFQNGLLLVLPPCRGLPFPDGLLHRGDLFLAEPFVLCSLSGGPLGGWLLRFPCGLLLSHFRGTSSATAPPCPWTRIRLTAVPGRLVVARQPALLDS